MSRPRILVACEYSGIVRDAFKERGWDAWSCDLLDSERHGGQHYVGDVRDMLEQEWDLMVAHPPCTFLSNSGAGHMYIGKSREEKERLGYKIDQERWANMEEGAAFFNLLWNADVPHIAVENPIMHGWGVERVGGRASQFVQPYEFGHLESKKTGFRLKHLPALTPSNNLVEAFKAMPKSETHKVHRMSPGPDRWKERSRTFPGIARAMAAQWGAYVEGALSMKEAA
jgi:hypothetical protein